MAVLGATDRTRLVNEFMRRQAETLVGVTKADLRAAGDATDAWIEANQAAFNAALPLPARTALTLTQKTLLFCFVAMRRAGILHAEEDG